MVAICIKYCYVLLINLYYIPDPPFLLHAILETALTHLRKSDSEVEADFVKKVMLSLGTNDISKHKNDVEQVNVNFTMCIEAAKQKYPLQK